MANNERETARTKLIAKMQAEVSALLAEEAIQEDIIIEQAAEIARLEEILSNVTPAIEALKKAVENQPAPYDQNALTSILDKLEVMSTKTYDDTNVQKVLEKILKKMEAAPGKAYDDTKLMKTVSGIAKKMETDITFILHRDSANNVQEIIVRRQS